MIELRRNRSSLMRGETKSEHMREDSRLRLSATVRKYIPLSFKQLANAVLLLTTFVVKKEIANLRHRFPLTWDEQKLLE